MSFADQAAARYLDGLKTHGATTQKTLEEMAGIFTFEGRPSCSVLSPLFLEGTTYDATLRDAEVVVRGLNAVIAHAARDRRLGDELGLVPRRRQWIETVGKDAENLVGRLDGFVTTEGVKFIEFNPVSQGAIPGCVGFMDGIRAAYLDMPAMKEIRDRFSIREISMFDATYAALVHMSQKAGKSGPPNICVVSADAAAGTELAVDEITLLPDGIRLIGSLMERGCNIQMCSTSDLVYRDSQLLFDECPIDLVMVGGHYISLDTFPLDHPLSRAVLERAVVTMDGYPRGEMLAQKTLFSYLSDPDSGVPLDEEVAAVVKRTIPWSRRVIEGTTTFHGERVNLTSFLRANRGFLVLKPSGGSGGEGVVLGWECEAEEWEKALASALVRGDYITQERVIAERRMLPVIKNGAIETMPMCFDLDPFVWAGGTARGAWVRVSESSRLNLSTGHGSETPVVVLDGEKAP